MSPNGGVAEWLKALLSKSSIAATLSRVRISPPPPEVNKGSTELRYNKVMADSIFTKIIKGEIPCHRVYEDDLTLAFLDIHPVQPGHMLVIPKKQIEFVWDLPDEDYVAVMAAVKKVALRLREVLGVRYVGERIVGVDVPHAHVQLIPFNTVDEFKAPQNMEAEPDHTALEQMAARLAF